MSIHKSDLIIFESALGTGVLDRNPAYGGQKLTFLIQKINKE